jgi:hypothetical protein
MNVSFARICLKGEWFLAPSISLLAAFLILRGALTEASRQYRKGRCASQNKRVFAGAERHVPDRCATALVILYPAFLRFVRLA